MSLKWVALAMIVAGSVSVVVSDLMGGFETGSFIGAFFIAS